MNSGAMCEHPGNVSTVDRLSIIAEVRILAATTADDDGTISMLCNNDRDQSFNNCRIVADVLVRRETVLGGEVPPLLAEDPLPPRDIQRGEEH